MLTLSNCMAPKVVLHVRLPKDKKMVSLVTEDGIELNIQNADHQLDKYFETGKHRC